MRIGIDGFNLSLATGSGVATYGHTLAETLATGGHAVEGIFGLDRDALAGRPSGWTTRRMIQMRAALPFPSARADAIGAAMMAHALRHREMPPFTRIASAPGLFALAHAHFRHHDRFLPLRMADPPAIMHWTYPLPVRLMGSRNIYTLHDLVPIGCRSRPATTSHIMIGSFANAWPMRSISAPSPKRGRLEIVELIGAPPEKVSNTYQAGLPPTDLSDTARAADAAMVAREFGLDPQGYFLFVGTIEPKKNVAALIQAYLASGVRTPLVLVGARGWGSEQVLAVLDRAGVAQRVMHLDYVPRDRLLGLIRLARAVLFPSLWEGFGLPVLEAFQFGTPVLTANTGGLAEVAGDAAIAIDPHDNAAMTVAICALEQDAALRERLSAAGLLRADRFSRERYLARLEAMYRRTLDRNEPL